MPTLSYEEQLCVILSDIAYDALKGKESVSTALKAAIKKFPHLSKDLSKLKIVKSDAERVAFLDSYNNKLIIAHRGTEPTNVGDLLNDFCILFASEPFFRNSSALEFMKPLEAEYPNVEKEHTGHSLGACNAIFVANKTGAKAIVFNPGGIGKSRYAIVDEAFSNPQLQPYLEEMTDNLLDRGNAFMFYNALFSNGLNERKSNIVIHRRELDPISMVYRGNGKVVVHPAIPGWNHSLSYFMDELHPQHSETDYLTPLQQKYPEIYASPKQFSKADWRDASSLDFYRHSLSIKQKEQNEKWRKLLLTEGSKPKTFEQAFHRAQEKTNPIGVFLAKEQADAPFLKKILEIQHATTVTDNLLSSNLPSIIKNSNRNISAPNPLQDDHSFANFLKQHQGKSVSEVGRTIQREKYSTLSYKNIQPTDFEKDEQISIFKYLSGKCKEYKMENYVNKAMMVEQERLQNNPSLGLSKEQVEKYREKYIKETGTTLNLFLKAMRNAKIDQNTNTYTYEMAPIEEQLKSCGKEVVSFVMEHAPKEIKVAVDTFKSVQDIVEKGEFSTDNVLGFVSALSPMLPEAMQTTIQYANAAKQLYNVAELLKNPIGLMEGLDIGQAIIAFAQCLPLPPQVKQILSIVSKVLTVAKLLLSGQPYVAMLIMMLQVLKMFNFSLESCGGGSRKRGGGDGDPGEGDPAPDNTPSSAHQQSTSNHNIGGSNESSSDSDSSNAIYNVQGKQPTSQSGGAPYQSDLPSANEGQPSNSSATISGNQKSQFPCSSGENTSQLTSQSSEYPLQNFGGQNLYQQSKEANMNQISNSPSSVLNSNATASQNHSAQNQRMTGQSNLLHQNAGPSYEGSSFRVQDQHSHNSSIQSELHANHNHQGQSVNIHSSLLRDEKQDQFEDKGVCQGMEQGDNNQGHNSSATQSHNGLSSMVNDISQGKEQGNNNQRQSSDTTQSHNDISSMVNFSMFQSPKVESQKQAVKKQESSLSETISEERTSSSDQELRYKSNESDQQNLKTVDNVSSSTTKQSTKFKETDNNNWSKIVQNDNEHDIVDISGIQKAETENEKQLVEEGNSNFSETIAEEKVSNSDHLLKNTIIQEDDLFAKHNETNLIHQKLTKKTQEQQLESNDTASQDNSSISSKPIDNIQRINSSVSSSETVINERKTMQENSGSQCQQIEHKKLNFESASTEETKKEANQMQVSNENIAEDHLNDDRYKQQKEIDNGLDETLKHKELLSKSTPKQDDSIKDSDKNNDGMNTNEYEELNEGSDFTMNEEVDRHAMKSFHQVSSTNDNMLCKETENICVCADEMVIKSNQTGMVENSEEAVDKNEGALGVDIEQGNLQIEEQKNTTRRHQNSTTNLENQQSWNKKFLSKPQQKNSGKDQFKPKRLLKPFSSISTSYFLINKSQHKLYRTSSNGIHLNNDSEYTAHMVNLGTIHRSEPVCIKEVDEIEEEMPKTYLTDPFIGAQNIVTPQFSTYSFLVDQLQELDKMWSVNVLEQIKDFLQTLNIQTSGDRYEQLHIPSFISDQASLYIAKATYNDFSKQNTTTALPWRKIAFQDFVSFKQAIAFLQSYNATIQSNASDTSLIPPEILKSDLLQYQALFNCAKKIESSPMVKLPDAKNGTIMDDYVIDDPDSLSSRHMVMGQSNELTFINSFGVKLSSSIDGLTYNNTISSILKHQFAYMDDPLLENLFWYKYSQRKLLCFDWNGGMLSDEHQYYFANFIIQDQQCTVFKFSDYEVTDYRGVSYYSTQGANKQITGEEVYAVEDDCAYTCSVTYRCSDLMRIYFGFICYDKDMEEIHGECCFRVKNSNVIFESLNEETGRIKITEDSKSNLLYWNQFVEGNVSEIYNWIYLRNIGIYNDLDYIKERPKQTAVLRYSGDGYDTNPSNSVYATVDVNKGEIQLTKIGMNEVKRYFKSGGKFIKGKTILMNHTSGGYDYIFGQVRDNKEWRNFQAIIKSISCTHAVTEITFRAGTRYIRPVILANWNNGHNGAPIHNPEASFDWKQFSLRKLPKTS